MAITVISVQSVRRCLLLSGLCASLLSACQSAVSPAPERILAGTAWDLVAIHPPGEQSLPLLPADPARISLRFEVAHRVLLRLDCNRGIGKWSSDAGATRAGRISFGNIAVTRALCAPPHWDERVARDLSFVRSYQFRNGRRYLSPTADGGVLEWQPRKSRESSKRASP